MTSVRKRPLKVVTDSEDDQSDSRTRRDLHLTSKRVSTIQEEDKKKSSSKGYSGFSHTLPIHTITKASVLSKEAPPENYSGFLRLGMLVLGASNIRLIIENYLKYGLLIGLPHSSIPLKDYGYFILAWMCIPISLIISVTVEYGMGKLALKAKDAKPDYLNKLSILERAVTVTHVCHLTILLTYPSYLTFTKIYHPLIGSGVIVLCLITFLKLTSFVLVNYELRQTLITGKAEQFYDDDAVYPNNVNVKNLLYFFFAPTLCYQPSYPRSPKFRKTFLLKRVGELITCLAMMYILSEQYAKPTLANSIKALEDKNLITIIERVLKLSTTAVVIWLLMFYALFHAFLNILAEILRFGDRTFYLAWWNSGNLATYWRLWNRPVYLFFKRHVYIPAVQRGVSPALCQFLVFFVSALLHEVLVGIPTHSITGFAFFGMIGQIPLIAATHAIEKWRGKGTSLGNTIFWIVFCVVGQPTIALLYYYQWTVNHKHITVV